MSKQQTRDADLKVRQQNIFSGNLDCSRNTTMFFIIEKAKEAILDFLQGTMRVL